MPDQNTMQTRYIGCFSVMWVPKLLLSPVKIRIFFPNHQIWPKIGIFGHFGPGLAGSFGALLVGWLVVFGARAVSRKTPIYFMSLTQVGRFLESALSEAGEDRF